MKTVSLINEKGGVGKTSQSVHIAAGLAILGHNVLLIDADAQAHSTYNLSHQEQDGLLRLLGQQAEWREVVRKVHPMIWAGEDATPAGNLYLLPAHVNIRALPMMDIRPTDLQERLEELESTMDFVVIDTSPTPSMFHNVIYNATDAVVFPTECEALALDGLAKSVYRMTTESRNRREKQNRPGIHILGVQPTMFDARTDAHRHGLELIHNQLGTAATWHPIAARTAWRDASFNRRTLFSYAPKSEAAAEAWGMVHNVLNAITQMENA